LHAETLARLQGKYDWVLNAKETLLAVKVWQPREEFDEIIKRVKSDEGQFSRV
jgi:hypothetical protein